MRHVSAKFVLSLLTDDQEENRVEIGQAILANAHGNENFLKNIMTGDEVFVYVYGVETKYGIIAVDGESVSLTKKSTDDSVKVQGVVYCVF